MGIPSFDDKLIQEVVRLILESIYEPTFSDYSHGFRMNKSCHTALKYVQKYFTGTKWFVEGDIKGCFDNVDHHILVAILRKRIADEHFIGLLWKFLKAGYMEDWNYHNTYSGTPQGSIISPILANIYMNELDSYMAEYAEKFNCGNRRKINPAFKKKLDVCRGKEQRLKRNLSKMSEEEKEGLIAEIRELRRSLKSTPYSDQMDDSYKRICYVRYADDFLIGVMLTLQGEMSHRVELGEDPRGNLTRIDNALAKMPERLTAVEAQLDNLYQQQAAAKAEVGKPFPYEKDLTDKTARLVELDLQLNLGSHAQVQPEQTVAKRDRPSILERLKQPLPQTTAKKKSQLLEASL